MRTHKRTDTHLTDKQIDQPINQTTNLPNNWPGKEII